MATLVSGMPVAMGRSMSFDLSSTPGPTMPDGLRAARATVDGRDILVLSIPHRRLPRIDALTGAEREVVDLVLSGLANVEIARTRRRSVRTVEKQIASALHKLDLRSRSELAVAVACGRGCR
jgi:DNA-binding NarL/FixJ family response regulator